jgi:diadenosine tetraphosphate (Ap4A) HIT family hydrolase
MTHLVMSARAEERQREVDARQFALNRRHREREFHMTGPGNQCLLCAPDQAATYFGRRTVWQNDLWRLSLVEAGAPVVGFGHLEPIRHVPYLTDLDGSEAATLGSTLARVTSTLKSVTGAELVYVYVFGDRVAHLHFNLAPHRDGDVLTGGPGLVRPGAPEVPAAESTALNRKVELALTDFK